MAARRFSRTYVRGPLQIRTPDPVVFSEPRTALKTLRLTHSEMAEVKAFCSPYGITPEQLAVRGLRLLIDTVRRYPHTPIARELVEQAGRWDEQVKPIVEID